MRCDKCGRSGFYVQTCCGMNLLTGVPLLVERIEKTHYSEETKAVLKRLFRYEMINKEDIGKFLEEIVTADEKTDTIKWKIRRLVEE